MPHDPRYIEGLRLFNARRWFDCHEVLEDVWRVSAGEEKLFYQALIQAAVSLYHYERGNTVGAVAQHKAMAAKLARLPGRFMEQDLGALSDLMGSLFEPLLRAERDGRPAVPPLDSGRVPVLVIPGPGGPGVDTP